jgi:hypothetical protein
VGWILYWGGSVLVLGLPFAAGTGLCGPVCADRFAWTGFLQRPVCAAETGLCGPGFVPSFGHGV